MGNPPIFISTKFPGDADAAGPETTLCEIQAKNHSYFTTDEYTIATEC